MLKTNVVNSIYVRKEKTIEFHLFYVEDNSKSKIYCQSYAKNPITLPRLKKGTIYIIFEASLGIMETNCSLLAIDFRIQQGIEQGLKQGMKQGRQEGIEEGKLDVVKRMLAKGYDVDTIHEPTGLPMEKIERMKG